MNHEEHEVHEENLSSLKPILNDLVELRGSIVFCLLSSQLCRSVFFQGRQSGLEFHETVAATSRRCSRSQVHTFVGRKPRKAVTRGSSAKSLLSNAFSQATQIAGEREKRRDAASTISVPNARLNTPASFAALFFFFFDRSALFSNRSR